MRKGILTQLPNIYLIFYHRKSCKNIHLNIFLFHWLINLLTSQLQKWQISRRENAISRREAFNCPISVLRVEHGISMLEVPGSIPGGTKIFITFALEY